MPVETLLYGDRKERRAVLLRRAAWGVVAVYLALLLFCSLSLLAINLSPPLNEVRLSPELAELRLFLLAFSGQTTGSLMLLIDLAIWGVRLGWRRRAAARSAPDGPESGIQA